MNLEKMHFSFLELFFLCVVWVIQEKKEKKEYLTLQLFTHTYAHTQKSNPPVAMDN